MTDEQDFNFLLQWAEAIESLDYGNPGLDKSFGMKQRPDGDIEIDEKFWEEDFHIPTCEKCNGVLKPNVRFSFSKFLTFKFTFSESIYTFSEIGA